MKEEIRDGGIVLPNGYEVRWFYNPYDGVVTASIILNGELVGRTRDYMHMNIMLEENE